VHVKERVIVRSDGVSQMSTPFSILVVDDNPSMAISLADVLEAKGFIVHAAFSGAEALEILNAHPVDVLLTDVKMPDMNGVALYRQVRKNHPQVITYFMTAYSADDIIQEGMREGVKTVLTKPLNIDLVVSILSAVQRMASKTF
jgi:CheY-like chemotaxis protein